MRLSSGGFPTPRSPDWGGDGTGGRQARLAGQPVALALRVEEARRTLAPVKAVHLLSGPRGPVVFSELYLPLGADVRRADWC